MGTGLSDPFVIFVLLAGLGVRFGNTGPGFILSVCDYLDLGRGKLMRIQEISAI